MQKKTEKIILYIGFGLYCAGMIYLLFLQRHPLENNMDYWEGVRASLNLIPLRTIRRFVRLIGRDGTSGYLVRFAAVNLAGNVGVFLPLGLFLPCIWNKQRKFLRFFVTVILVIIAVELTQLFTTLGSCDVDDLLLNSIGASMGFGIWKLPPVNRLLRSQGFA